MTISSSLVSVLRSVILVSIFFAGFAIEANFSNSHNQQKDPLIPMSLFSIDLQKEQKKLLAEIDFAGWVEYENLLIGEFNSKWIVALERKNLQPKWWLSNKKGLSVPPLVEGKFAFIAFKNGSLSKVDLQTGLEVWTILLDSFVDRPIVIKNSFLFLQTAAQNFYRIDEKGQVKWVFNIGSSRNTVVRSMVSPLVFENRIFLSDTLGGIVCLNHETGQEYWRYNPDDLSPNFNQVMGEMRLFDKTLIISRYDGWFGGISISDDQSVHTQWSMDKFSGNITFSVYSNGLYFVSSSDGYLYAVDVLEKKIKWKSLLGSAASFISPGEDRIYITTTEGYILILSSQNGKLVTSYNLRERILVSPIKYQEGKENYLLYPSPSKTFYLFKI